MARASRGRNPTSCRTRTGRIRPSSAMAAARPESIGRLAEPSRLSIAADVLEQPGRVLERLLVPPEPQKLAPQGQDRPEVDGRADVLLPAPLEHERRVEDHQADREQDRQHEHARGEEVSHPRRIVSTARHPWDSFLRLRPDSVPQVPGCERRGGRSRRPPRHRRREPGEPYDRENPYHSLHRQQAARRLERFLGAVAAGNERGKGQAACTEDMRYNPRFHASLRAAGTHALCSVHPSGTRSWPFATSTGSSNPTSRRRRNVDAEQEAGPPEDRGDSSDRRMPRSSTIWLRPRAAIRGSSPQSRRLSRVSWRVADPDQARPRGAVSASSSRSPGSPSSARPAGGWSGGGRP